MFGFSLGFRLSGLQLNEGPGQTLEVSRPPDTPDPDPSLFPMMVRSTHSVTPFLSACRAGKKTRRAPHPAMRASYCYVRVCRSFYRAVYRISGGKANLLVNDTQEQRVNMVCLFHYTDTNSLTTYGYETTPSAK
jgi:hypothetical protein